jgi:hypothetical protein
MRPLALLLVSTNVWAYCPSYTASSASNTHDCGVETAPGTNPTTAQWQPIFDLVSQDPTVWNAADPTVPTIKSGCDKPTPPSDVTPRFPCELLKAIAMNESGWKQFCVPESPADQVGKPSQTIISFDCGYGIGQVTSGMHTGEMPAFDRAKVASDPTYNLATGTQILASKWRATKCVGDRQPAVVEHWYIATWAYNGLAYSNSPSNPNYDAMRPVCNPNVGCPNRPYQERVFGWMEHPPSANHWKSVALAYPDRADIPDMPGVIQRVPDLPEPDCAGPTDCVNKRSTHVTACAPQASPSPTPTPSPTMGPDPMPDMATRRTGDGGEDGTEGVPDDGGCSCDVGRAQKPSLALLLFALLFLLRASKK